MKEHYMTCADHQRTISRFVDHELKATGCTELFEHLGRCEECRQFFDTILTLGAELDKIQSPTTEMPMQPDLASIRQTDYRVANQRRMAPRPSSLLFAVVVILVVTLLLSIDVTIEKPNQVMPSASTSQR